MIIKYFPFFVFVFFLSACSSGVSKGKLRVGVDREWYPIDFGTQTSYVNGYTEELLLEMAKYSGIEFELVSSNWDSLLEGLKEKKYDAVLTSLPPYEYNKAKYDFSTNFLDLGPVLISPKTTEETDLSKLDGQLVGVIANDPAILILERYPALLVRNYNRIPDLLNAIVAGEIGFALLDRIPATNFVNDLYRDQLKIVGNPLTDKGLHLVAPKGEAHRFNTTLESLRKKKTLDTLLKKWSLS